MSLPLPRLVRRLRCRLGWHNFVSTKENKTVKICKECKQYKTGEAIHENGMPMFVLSDGSAIVMGKIEDE